MNEYKIKKSFLMIGLLCTTLPSLIEKFTAVSPDLKDFFSGLGIVLIIASVAFKKFRPNFPSEKA
jgi:hypothetical protein